MLGYINHIGIVVQNIDEAINLYSEVFGFQPSDILVSQEEGIKTTMVSAGCINIELMEPIDPQGGVGKFLAKRGEGLHHISFRVDNMEMVLDSLATKGIHPIGNQDTYFLDHKVRFIHPRFTRGILIELIQKI